MAVGASRSELLEWINQTYNLQYTKIEQCGSGAIYCQIFDSIHGDLPMYKVNFNPSSDYQILNNYKILQNGFSKHKISREVPVERLMKCRFQDNLEFLQWLSKLWSETKLDGYDAGSRRKSVIPSNTPSRRVVSGTPSTSTASSASRRTSVSGGFTVQKQRVASTNTNTRQPGRVTSGSSATTLQRSKLTNHNSQSEGLLTLSNELKVIKAELNESKQIQENLETERNFYFNKLRDIEIFFQNLNEKINAEKNIDVNIDELVSHVQEILYSTTEGFQVPEDGELLTEQVEIVDDDNYIHNNKENTIHMMDEETF